MSPSRDGTDGFNILIYTLGPYLNLKSGSKLGPKYLK